MTQAPILTVTLNPALDLATEAEAVLPGAKLRCTAPQADPGGGGINVSRVIRRLGGDSLAVVGLGGSTGARLSGLVAREGLRLHRIDAPGETRQSLAVTERASGAQFRFVMPGPAWSRRRERVALREIVEAAPPDAFIVLSGSQPPGVSDDLPATLARRLARRGGRVVLDTSGPALARAAEGGSGIHVLRMDGGEAETISGLPLARRQDSADFAAGLVAREAAAIVVIARGAEGSVMATREGRWFAAAADVPVRSKIGAGDSFVGAFTLAMARGRPLPRALQEGMAAASATVMSAGTALCRAADVRRLVAACPVTPL